MARRVNTKFLTIFTVIVVALCLLGLLGKKLLVRESPEKYVAAGQQYMAEKKYEDAVKMFQKAVGLDDKNPALWVTFGDALNQLSPQDIEYMRRARAAWDQALIVDPNFKPALDRMMSFWSDVANLDSSRPEVFEQLGGTAKKLFAADSRNAAAEVAIETSVIRPWLGGVEKNEKDIREKIARLEELTKKYPENPDLPMFTAQAKLRMSERERQRERATEATKLANEATKVMEDALKRTPTATMYFSAAQVAQVQEAMAGTGGLEHRKKKQEYYAKAQQLVKPDDPLFVNIHISAARAAEKREEAERILRALMKERQEDQQVRLALAEQLAMDKDSRKEALEILDRQFAAQDFKGPKAYMVRELQVRTLVMSTNLRLDEYSSASKEDREKLLPKIQQNLAMIEQKDTEGPRSLRLRGKLLRFQGETVKAIQTLEKARALAEKQGNIEMTGDRLDRWEVTDLLAKAYIDTNQTGRAKDLLTELVNRFPQYEPARILLANVLVREGNLEEAKPHVKVLAERKPDDPDVIKLGLQVLDSKNTDKVAAKDRDPVEQKKQIKATYARLPEETAQQMIDKANAAMVVDQQDDAVRLLDKLRKTAPGDYEGARMAVRVYRYLGELEKAKDYVDAAVAANPKDDKLQVLKRQVADLTPEGVIKVTLEEAEKNPDPIAKALIKASCYRRLKKMDEALKYLKEAQALRPKDTDITALTFNHYLDTKEWDKADGLLETLAAANQDQCGGKLFRYRLAMAREDYRAALGHAQDLVQRMGEFGESWLALAQALQATGNTEEALSKYLSALEKKSDSPEVLRGLVECYYMMGRPNDARRYIAQARKAMPNNSQFLEMEIQHELNYGDPEKAILPREDMVKKNPERPQNVLGLGQAYLAAARVKDSKPDTRDQAAALFARAKATFKQGINKWPDEIMFYAYYAETGARSGDLGDSEQVLKTLAARDAWKGKSDPDLLLAEYYGVAKRLGDAEKMYHAIIAKDPKNTEVQVRLANLMMNQKKVDEAIKALDANADDPRIARRRVEILTNVGRADEANKTIDGALAKSPSNLDLLHMSAGVNIARRQYDVVDQRLKRALEIDEKNTTTHYYVGLLEMNKPKGDLDEAMKHLTIGKDSPTMGIEARFAMADCMRRKSNPDAAIRELEAALSAQPTNRRVRLGLIDAYMSLQPPRWVDAERVIRDAYGMPGYVTDSELLQREASMWAVRGEPKKAVDAIQKALTAEPDNIQLTRSYINLLIKVRKYSDVVAEVDKLVARDKNLWWAYEARAVAKRYQDHKDEAIKDFEAALAAANALNNDDAAAQIVRTMGDVIGPDEVIMRIHGRAEKEDRWKIMIARLQQAKGDNEAAVKTLEQVLAREEQLLPQDRESALRFAGTLYLLVNAPEKSSKCYEKLLVLAPDDMTALNNMACLLAEVMQPPRPQDGLQYSERAYNLMRQGGRRDALVLDTHGWLLTLCGRVDEGIEILRMANEMKPLPDAHYHLAEAYLRKQFADQALKELEIALDLIKRCEQDKTPVDPMLKGKVESAMSRAGVMQRQKKTTAVAPTATNDP